MGIYRKGENWFIDYYVDGRRKREKIGASKSLAKEAWAKRRAEIAERRFFPERQGASITFAEFSDLYWERHWRHLKAKGKASVRTALLRAFGTRTLQSITCGLVQDFYNAKKAETSAATANRYLARIAHMFTRARKWGHFHGVNPAQDVEKAREEASKVRFLSRSEIERLLAVADSRLLPVLQCALHTGMRRGEILGLRWEHVDLSQRVIHILRAKSGKPREVPITRQLLEVLRGLQPALEGPVFRISLSTLRRRFAEALAGAEISNFRFHDLRHTFASHHVMSNSDLPALQHLLGHSTLKMTSRYAHLSKAYLSSGMDRFSEGMPDLVSKKRP